MTTATATAPNAILPTHRLADQYSLEMTAKDTASLAEAAPLIAPGTRISVTFLPGEEPDARIAAAAMVRRLGFVPVPHISARRLGSSAELEAYLEALIAQAQVNEVFVVAGDPPTPLGPFEDALAVIRSGLLARYGIGHVGISGYPEGHPEIGHDKLRKAMLDKQAELHAQSIDYAIMTQFGFDPQPVLHWLAQIRADGVHGQVRVGVPGPTSIKTLLRFATRCGVGASASVLKKYGISVTRLLGTAGPDRFVNALASGLQPDLHGDVALHFYPFGGLTRTAQWVAEFAQTARGATR